VIERMTHEEGEIGSERDFTSPLSDPQYSDTSFEDEHTRVLEHIIGSCLATKTKKNFWVSLHPDRIS
jgi:hypothetical protein